MPDRPIDLNLFKLHLPVMGWVSILHRVTGVVLFVGLPLMLYQLQQSLANTTGFAETLRQLNTWWGGLIVWTLLVSLAFHIFSGIRHLALDVHVGVEKYAARRSAILVLVASGLAAMLVAGWLWR